MAQAWIKKYLTMKPEVNKIFEDLEAYSEFCVKYGYVFNEAHLYNDRTPWGEFHRVQNGKYPRDNWGRDPKPHFAKPQFSKPQFGRHQRFNSR
jgi:hypothetical protein